MGHLVSLFPFLNWFAFPKNRPAAQSMVHDDFRADLKILAELLEKDMPTSLRAKLEGRAQSLVEAATTKAARMLNEGSSEAQVRSCTQSSNERDELRSVICMARGDARCFVPLVELLNWGRKPIEA